jgi:hypothetical protein
VGLKKMLDTISCCKGICPDIWQHYQTEIFLCISKQQLKENVQLKLQCEIPVFDVHFEQTQICCSQSNEL